MHQGPRQTMFVGEIYPTKTSGVIRVVDYKGTNCVTVEFPDGRRTVTSATQIRLGSLRNPFQPVIEGVGYLGIPYNSYGVPIAQTPEYKAWVGMLKRSYSSKHKAEFTAYQGVDACPEWNNFSVFADWFKKQEGFDKGWHLEKDLKIKGNKLYSPEGCCLVPQEINNILLLRDGKRGKWPVGVHLSKQGRFIAQVGLGSKNTYIGSYDDPVSAFKAYKIQKEAHVKEVALHWQDKIAPAVFNSLMNFTVNIDD